MAINTKEQLRDYIHSIHDYIRNSGAGYGMNALKIFNVFYTLKLLENKMVNIGFNEKFDWHYIKKSINEHNFKNTVHEWIYDTINELRSIYLNDNTKMHPLTKDIKNILDIVLDCKNNTGKNKELQHIEDEICKILKKQREDVNKKKKLKKIAYFIYFQLPADLKQEFIKDMFIMIDNLSFISESKNFDIRGKIYEYFIGRDKNAMSDLGAYFTDRHLTNFIMDEVGPVLDKNGNVQTMIDPFAGSGGMTLSYVSYINQKYKVNWENENYQNVFHFDMAEDVVKIAGIEYYSLTGHFPSYEEKKFYRTNSFTYDEFLKYKYLITNPPYGGDKSTKSADTINRECIIEYNKKEINTLLDKMDISPIKYKDIEKTIFKDIDKGICDFINTKESVIIKEKIEHFIEYAKKLFNKYNFDEYKEEILKISRLCIQNKLYLQINAINSKKQEELQVNYNTCGNNIKQYSKKIVNDYHNIQKNLITNTIDNELLKLNKDEEPLKYKQFESYKIQLSKNPTDKIIIDELEKFADKESCSLILLMSLLDNDGVCAGVLKEGVFFDTNYSKLRGYLINNFNVSKVISVSADQFENTTTKTSIIIFKNDGKKTEKIEFYDLDIEKYSDDKIIFGDNSDFIEGLVYGNVNIEPKNKISNVNKKLISTASFDELSKVIIKYNKNNELQFDIPFSFNSKDYIKKEIVCGDDYELVKLRDICEINSEKKLLKNEYNYVEISDINDNYITNFEKLTKDKLPVNAKNIVEYQNILISSVRPKKSKMLLITEHIKNINDYVFSTALANIKLKNKNISQYIYSILYSLVDNFENELCNGSSYPRFKPSILLDLKIPIPKSQAKIQEWVDKISKPYDKMNSNKSKINELEEKVKNRIKEICENEDCDEVELNTVCSFKTGIKFTMSNHYKDKGKYGYIRINNLQEGNNNMIYLDTDGYNKCINCRVKKDDLLLSDVSEKTLVKFVPTEWDNYVYYGSVIKCYNILIDKYYLYNYFLSDNFNIQRQNKEKGSIQKHLTLEILNKLKIQIPKNKKLIQNLEPTFQKIETLQTEMKEAETLYKQLIKELSEEALPSNKNVSTITTNNNENDDISEEEINSQEEDIKHNIVSIKNIDYIEEDSNYYSIDSHGQKDCLCYTTDASGKIKKYKDILIKEPLVTMLSMSSGRNNKNNM